MRVSFVIRKATGSEKRTVIVATQRIAIQPTKTPYLPRLKGRDTKDLRARFTRKKMKPWLEMPQGSKEIVVNKRYELKNIRQQDLLKIIDKHKNSIAKAQLLSTFD